MIDLPLPQAAELADIRKRAATKPTNWGVTVTLSKTLSFAEAQVAAHRCWPKLLASAEAKGMDVELVMVINSYECRYGLHDIVQAVKIMPDCTLSAKYWLKGRKPECVR